MLLLIPQDNTCMPSHISQFSRQTGTAAKSAGALRELIRHAVLRLLSDGCASGCVLEHTYTHARTHARTHTHIQSHANIDIHAHAHIAV